MRKTRRNIFPWKMNIFPTSHENNFLKHETEEKRQLRQRTRDLESKDQRKLHVIPAHNIVTESIRFPQQLRFKLFQTAKSRQCDFRDASFSLRSCHCIEMRKRRSKPKTSTQRHCVSCFFAFCFFAAETKSCEHDEWSLSNLPPPHSCIQ